jgi:hypothetical protein
MTLWGALIATVLLSQASFAQTKPSAAQQIAKGQ